MIRKGATVAVACLAIASIATGCANTPKATPTPIPTVMPQTTTVAPLPTTSATATPMASPMTSPEASPATSPSASPEESPAPSQTSSEAAKKIVDEVDKLSEIEKTSAIVMGDTALVGVEFAQQYAGSMTTRIKDMVSEKAKAASADIKNVVVTADPDLYTRVVAMSDKITAGDSGSSIASEFTEIVNRIMPQT